MARRTILLVLGLLLAASIPAYSATIHVPADQPTIQAGISASAGGDTVLVSPGTYQEALSWANKDLVLLGDGIAASVLVTTNSTARVLLLGPGVTGQTVLRNLSFREGLAEEGGGLKLVAASPVLVQCRFESNVASRVSDYPMGGAVFVDQGSHPVIEDCFFGYNRAEATPPYILPAGFGAGIYVASHGSLEVRRCLFQENVSWGFEGGAGGGIFVAATASAQIDSCTFIRNLGFGGGVYSTGDVNISRCAFEGNMGYTGAGIYAPGGNYVIRQSIFFDNEPWGIEGGTIDAYRQGEISGNTVAFNRCNLGYAGITAPEATTTRNIICFNQGWGLGCVSTPQSLACNDVWGNEFDGAPANYECTDQTGLNGNISLDPLFCDAVNGDFTLDGQSPCAPAHSPAGCGLIGALPVGCGVTDVAGSVAPPAELRLSVTPNPVRGVAEFAFPGVGPRVLAIFDSQGRLVDRLTGNDGRWVWTPGASAPAGVYFARLDGAGVTGEPVKFIYLR